MPKPYEQLAGKYEWARKGAEYHEKDLKSTAGEKVAATPEANKAHAEKLQYLRDKLQKYRDETHELKKQGAAFADQNNPGNTEMFLDAYNDYLEHLSKQSNAPDSQIDAIIETIDSLEKLQKNQTVKSDADSYPIPEEILKTLSPEDTEKIKLLYYSAVLQRVADFKGTTIPESEFSPEKLTEFWHQAAASLKFDIDNVGPNEGTEELDEEEPVRPKGRLEGAVRRRTLVAPWTVFTKPRRRM